jgi:hypothetical protein
VAFAVGGIARQSSRFESDACLAIRDPRDARVLMNSFGGCTVELALATAGLAFRLLFPPTHREPSAPLAAAFVADTSALVASRCPW